MKYRINSLNNDKLSMLGFGCMRFPKDESETERMIAYAIENGLNFFDTAYIYGGSEAVLGRILKKLGKRKDVTVATKIPPYLVKKYSEMDKIFNKQLERLQTDYIDYYFIHMLTDVNVWKRLIDLGILKWIEEKKTSGQIRRIGFSYHGGQEEFIRLCDIYPWEFCMIQYNYLDENNLAGKNGLLHAHGKGMPVIVMEPLRGGVLANNLPKAALKAFEEAHEKRTPAEWALRWLWNQPEVTCVLSGMSNLNVLKENIDTALSADVHTFTENDQRVVAEAKKALADTIKVPCTACGYCMPCPQGVDIPTCLFCYNETAIGGKMHALANYFTQTSLTSKPHYASLCNGCRQCERKCPQQIEIVKELKNTRKAFERFYFKPVVAAVRRFMRLQ
jgi:hypothetical protein